MNVPLRALGIDATTGRPLEPVTEAVARRQMERMLRRARPPRYGVATGDLASAGWGVVFAEGVDAAARDALGPLLHRRRRQAGDRFRELTYRSGEGAAEFRSRLRAGHGRVDPRQVPWYLLLVGDPEDLPHGFELDLDVPHAVGRLTGDDAGDLAAYARRVVEAEDRPPRRAPRAAVFAPTHPDDPPTAACARHLARPLARLAGPDASVLVGRRATRAALLEMIAGGPDLLVAAGHSAAFPSNHGCQRERQGALICADWPGPVRRQGAIPAAHTVAAEDLPFGALAAGVAILFGCHTAGTPRHDVYAGHRRKDARVLTARAFVAALPRRLLGREGGALAVIGHVGRAFEASFFWRGARQTGPFEDAVRALLDGRRLGEALDGFGQRFADVAVTWARSRMDPQATRPDPLDLWVAFHDARSWSLLGDPAVRLPACAEP
ncbi:MAG TPA: hypothetical protein VGG06_18515 [Thermoanaerobaculia bacterium]